MKQKEPGRKPRPSFFAIYTLPPNVRSKYEKENHHRDHENCTHTQGRQAALPVTPIAYYLVVDLSSRECTGGPSPHKIRYTVAVLFP